MPVGPDPAVAQRVDRRAERGDLGEGTLDGDLPAEHVERMELDEVLVAGDAVDQDRSAVAGQRNADVAHAGGARGLDDDVEPVAAGRLIAQPAEVGLGVAPVDLHGAVDAQRLGGLQLERARCRHRDGRRAAVGDQLGEQQARSGPTRRRARSTRAGPAGSRRRASRTRRVRRTPRCPWGGPRRRTPAAPGRRRTPRRTRGSCCP